jgi:class 3 adenylate cyclase/CHASE2 domain-containing sensor protein
VKGRARLLAALAWLLPVVFALWFGWFAAPGLRNLNWEIAWLDRLQILRVWLRGADPPDPGLLLIAVDGETVAQLDKPQVFWVKDFADLGASLLKSGAKAVAFDYIFPSASGAAAAPVKAQMEIDRLAMLEQLVSRKVALGYQPDSANQLGEHNHLDLEAAAANAGNLCSLALVADSDGLYRSLYPVFAIQEATPDQSLALWLVKQLGHKTEWRDGQLLVNGAPVPLEANASQPRLRINYRTPLRPFLPAATLLRRVAAGQPIPEAAGKVCVVAPWDPVADFRPSVYDQLPGKRDQGGTRGVEHHLAAAETMLRGHFLVPYSPWLGSAASVFSTLLLLAVGYRARLHFWWLAGILLGYALLNVLAFSYGEWWLPFWAPLLSGVLGYGAGYEWRYLTTERQRRLTHDMFARMVAPQVVDHVLSAPGLRQLGGVQRRVTVLYTDINDFTPMCERHTPPEVIVMLNKYFEAMVSVIFRRQGMLKQFVGDEIMVIYGAPMEQPDHAARAVDTALDMLERLHEMESEAAGEDGFFDIKVGIHTGDVVVGHVGSEKHMEYAAVGDDVNLGARIMSSTKKLGVKILVSEVTKREAEPVLKGVEWISHGVQSFKGKTAQMEVFEVRRVK